MTYGTKVVGPSKQASKPSLIANIPGPLCVPRGEKLGVKDGKTETHFVPF